MKRATAVSTLAIVSTAVVSIGILIGIVGAALFGAPAGAASKPESCALLRVNEIATALSQPTTKAKASSVPGVCDWPLNSTATRPTGSLHTLVLRGSTAKASYKLASQFHVDDRETLTDLGKKAFYAPSLGTVWILEDDSTVFYVQGVYATGAEVDAASLREALVGLAIRAEARL